MYEIRFLNRRDKWETYGPIKARSPKQALWYLTQKLPGSGYLWSRYGTEMVQIKDVSGNEQMSLF